MDFGVKITGAKELSRGLLKSANSLGSDMDKYIQKATYSILGRTRTVTPVDTGFLRHASMQTTFKRGSGKIEARAPYAFYVHEGTKRMRSRPFFDEGIAMARTELRNILGDVIDINLKKI